MSSSATVPKPATAPAADGFLSALARHNPFGHHRVTAAGAPPLDVDTIHDAEFRQLTALARRAHDENEAVAAVVWGESGAGKSNLLQRLAKQAGDLKAVVVPVLGLHAAPDRLHRAVLSAVVSRLTAGGAGPWPETPLYHMMRGLALAMMPPGKPYQSMPELKARYDEVAAGMTADAGGGAAATAAHVLYRFFKSVLAVEFRRVGAAPAAAAARWLRGEPLDAAETAAIRLRPGEAAAALDPAQSADVLALLAQLLRAGGATLILCFDQIHTLPPAQVQAVLRLLHDLNDRLRNTLLALAEVKAELVHLQQSNVAGQATWDRLTANKIEMPRITPAQARHILQKRLQPFVEPFEGVAAVGRHVKQDSLFPLGDAWFDGRFGGAVDLRPRRAIDAARERWDELQHALAAAPDPAAWLAAWPPPIVDVVINKGDEKQPPPVIKSEEELIDACVAEALDARLAKHHADPNALPPNEDNLRGLVRALLTAAGVAVVKPAGESAFDMLTRPARPGGDPLTAGVVFIAGGHAARVTAAFRAMLAGRGGLDRVFLVTDGRSQLTFGKSGEAKGRKYYDELRGVAGFEHVDLPFPDYAALEAFDTVARQAADLAIDTPAGRRPLTRADVFAAYRRQGRLESHPLLGRFLGASPPPAPEAEPMAVTDDEVRAFIAGRLGITIGTDTRELATMFLGELPAGRRAGLDVLACQARIEAVAHAMADAKAISMRPAQDGFFLLPQQRPAG